MKHDYKVGETIKYRLNPKRNTPLKTAIVKSIRFNKLYNCERVLLDNGDAILIDFSIWARYLDFVVAVLEWL